MGNSRETIMNKSMLLVILRSLYKTLDEQTGAYLETQKLAIEYIRGELSKIDLQ